MKGYALRLGFAILTGLVCAELLLQATHQTTWIVRAALAGVAALYEPIVWVEDPPSRSLAIGWAKRTLVRHAVLLLVFDLTIVGMAGIQIDQALYIGGMQIALLLTLATGMAKVLAKGTDALRWRLYRTLMISALWTVLGTFIGLAYSFEAAEHVHFLIGGLFSLVYGVFNMIEVNRSGIQYLSGR